MNLLTGQHCFIGQNHPTTLLLRCMLRGQHLFIFFKHIYPANHLPFLFLRVITLQYRSLWLVHLLYSLGLYVLPASVTWTSRFWAFPALSPLLPSGFTGCLYSSWDLERAFYDSPSVSPHTVLCLRQRAAPHCYLTPHHPPTKKKKKKPKKVKSKITNQSTKKKKPNKQSDTFPLR